MPSNQPARTPKVGSDPGYSQHCAFSAWLVADERLKPFHDQYTQRSAMPGRIYPWYTTGRVPAKTRPFVEQNCSSKRMKTIHRILCLMIALLLAILISSCCNRPYAAGSQTWPQENKYPQGPYDLMVRCYRIQTGVCPKANDRGAKVTIIIWNFNHQNILFHDTFKSDLYFEDVYARFQKDGSVVVVDDKSNRTVRRYSRISDKQWRYQP